MPKTMAFIEAIISFLLWVGSVATSISNSRLASRVASTRLSISVAIISVSRNACHKRRMTKGPTEKLVAARGLLAVLNDPRMTKVELRSQLEDYNEEELDAGVKIVKRLLDSTLIPMSWIMFFCNHLDRSSLASARIMGLSDDLGMSSGEYGLAMMILFIAYLFAQVPSNIYLAKGRPSIYLPSAMFLWGCVCTGTAFVRTPTALYTVRFLLGLLEAPFAVGCLLLISSWYTRTELGLRTAVLLSAPSTANAFAGIIAHAVGVSLEGSHGFEAWRWLFLVAGTGTVFIACFAFFVLPDFPEHTQWLSEEERAVAQLRMIVDRGVSEYKVDRAEGFKMAAKDWKVWTLAGTYFSIAIGSSLHNFFPSVVETLGFVQNTTLWMTAPPYLFAMVVAISTAISSDRCRNASFHIVGAVALAMVGFLLFLFVQSQDRRGLWTRYVAGFLMLAGSHAAGPVVLAWTQKTIAEPREKRAVALAIVNTCGTLAQIATSQLYPEAWAPRFIPSMSLNIAFGLLTILVAIFLREKLRRANKVSDQEEAADVEGGTPSNLFRYIT